MSIYSHNSSKNIDRAIPLLKTVELFRELEDQQLMEVAEQMIHRKYSAGVTLFHQGMPGTMLYLIETGSVRVFGVGQTGAELTFNTFSSGDVFGELSVFDGKERTASAITQEETSVWLLSRDDFHRLWERHPVLCRAAVSVLAGRVRTAATLVENIVFQDVLGGLAYELLNLSDRHGKLTEIGIEIGVPMTQRDLATMVGATRESVNRGLRFLRSKNYIKVEADRFWVLDQDGLQAVIEQRGR